jgi:hypothetical protein
MDLLEKYCQGFAEAFAEQVCEHYLQTSEECRLLKEQTLQAVFAQGRCQPREMVKQAVKKLFYQQPHDPLMVKEEIESFAFELAEAIQQKSLNKNFTIYALKRYITTTVENALRPHQQCKDCMHLSPGKPAYCQRKTLVTAEGESENPLHGQKRFPSDRACQGFEALALAPPEPTYPGPPLNLLVVADALSQRAAQAQNGLKLEYERQYLVFCSLAHWCEAEKSSWKTGKEQIAVQMGVSVRTIERDLNSLLDFLEQEQVV